MADFHIWDVGKRITDVGDLTTAMLIPVALDPDGTPSLKGVSTALFMQKIFAAPIITGGLGIRSSGAAFDLQLTSSEVFTASRALNIVLGNAARTLTIGASASVSGSNTGDNAVNTSAQAYADALVVGLLDDRGNYDASVNTFPASGGSGSAGAVLKGDLWTISVAGTLGGHAVTAGDVVRALADTPGQTDGNWAISENNFGYVAENSANKVTAFSTPTDVQYPSAKLVSDQLALKLSSGGNGSAANLTGYPFSSLASKPTTLSGYGITDGATDSLVVHLAGTESITGAKTFSATTVISGASFGLSGNISAAAWTTSGIRYKNVAATLTDTSSSGTVATAYTDVWGGNTIAASSAATFTNYFGSYFNDPVAGTNVTLTNKWALGADSLKVGTSNQTTITTSGVITATAPVFLTRINVGGTTSSFGALQTDAGSHGQVWVLDATGNINSDGGLKTNQIWVQTGSFSSNTAAQFRISNTALDQSANSFIAWTNTDNDATATRVTSISQIAPGLLGVGAGSQGSFAGNLKLTDITAVGNVAITGTVNTGDPTSGAGPAWRLGAKKTGTLVLDTANYVEISVAGVTYKVALIQ